MCSVCCASCLDDQLIHPHSNFQASVSGVLGEADSRPDVPNSPTWLCLTSASCRQRCEKSRFRRETSRSLRSGLAICFASGPSDSYVVITSGVTSGLPAQAWPIYARGIVAKGKSEGRRACSQNLAEKLRRCKLLAPFLQKIEE